MEQEVGDGDYEKRGRKHDLQNPDPKRHNKENSARKPEGPSKKTRIYVEDEKDAVSCYEALSVTSQLLLNGSLAGSKAGKSDMSHLSYNSWDDNKSLMSCVTEHTIAQDKYLASQKFKNVQELVNFDEATIARIRERSRSRDIRGQRIKSITGVEIPINIPARREVSDEESDFEVDMGKIATNIPNLGSHIMHKYSELAEFNQP